MAQKDDDETDIMDLLYVKINEVGRVSKANLQNISYLIGEENLTNLDGVVETFKSWDVPVTYYIPLLATILSLADLKPLAKKVDPKVDINSTLENCFEEEDGDDDIINKMKMRSVIIRVCGKLHSSAELHKSFIQRICTRNKFATEDYMEGYELFRKLEQTVKLTPDDMSLIEWVLNSGDTFKSIQINYNKWKAELFPQKESPPSQSTASKAELETSGSDYDSGHPISTSSTCTEYSTTGYASEASIGTSHDSFVTSSNSSSPLPPDFSRHRLSTQRQTQSCDIPPDIQNDHYQRPRIPSLPTRPNSHHQSHPLHVYNHQQQQYYFNQESQQPQQSPVLHGPSPVTPDSAFATNTTTLTSPLGTTNTDISTLYGVNPEEETGPRFRS